MDRQQRIEIVNKIISEIASKGRQFFRDKKDGFISKIIEKNGRLYFIDHYNRHEIYLHQPKYRNWRKFTQGGTMRALVLDFKDFIMKGGDTNHNNGYGGLYCPHWGYPQEDMKSIQKFAEDVGYLKPKENGL